MESLTCLSTIVNAVNLSFKITLNTTMTREGFMFLAGLLDLA